MKWFFHTFKDVVHMRARAEGPGGIVGDAFCEIRKGEDAYGVPYAILAKTGVGVLSVGRHGRGRILPQRKRPLSGRS
jgi:hypothetical protein